MTKEANKKTEDLTGQDRFAWNLFVSWASQLVLVFSGFIMPRLVDEQVGQVALGIWDFGWSFVSYLTLLGFGMGACFNRYIAKYRSAGDFIRLNEIANSAVFVQLIVSIVVTACTILFYFLLPYFFSDSLKENTEMAQWVILLLGFSLSVEMIAGSAKGLLTGYHRWDIHNGLHAVDSIFSLILMVAILYFTDFSIAGMALGYLIATIVVETIRFVLVGKYCKEFNFNLRLANISTCKEMLIFSIKSMLSNLPPILLLQSINIILVSAIGPAALAVFARPMALTRQIKTFMAKFTLMLTPTTGSMQGAGDMQAIQSLFINMTTLSFAFALPGLGFLFIYGDVILQYWMGHDYALWGLMMILALGQLLPMAQDTSIRILMGMNQHGRISIYAFIIVFITFAIGLLFSGINDWQLTTAALLFVVPMNVVYGLVIPIYTCRQLNLSWLSYIHKSLVKPMFYIIPFLLLLFYSRYAFDHNDHLDALIAFIVALLVTGVIYFIYLLPQKAQRKVLFFCRLKHGL